MIVQSGAGAGIGFDDSHYQAAGGSIDRRAEDIFASTDMIVKVKEPQLGECQQLHNGQTLFTYLHLAADREQTRALIDLRCDRDRLRDRDRAGRVAAAVDTDE